MALPYASLAVLLTLICALALNSGGAALGSSNLVSVNKASEIDFISPSFALLDHAEAQPNCMPELKPVPLSAASLAPFLDQVKSAFDDNFHRNKYTGASAVLTYRDEVIWSWNAGYRSLSPPLPVDSHTRFRVASVSKAFTATALFKLVADGILPSVDTKIVSVEPSFAVRNPFAATVGERQGRDLTFRALAAHLSGLQREAPCPLASCNLTTSVLLPWLEKNYLVRPPNQKPSYSNLGYALLGNLLADSVLKGAKGNYADMMKTFIFEQLAMNETGFNPTSDDIANFATGFVGGQPVPFYPVDWLNPSAGLFISTDDAAKWMIDLMRVNGPGSQPSQLFSQNEAALREFFEPVFLNPDNITGISAPWETTKRYQYWVQEKSGALPGFSAIVSMIPELRLGLAVFVNTPGRSTDWTRLAHEILVPSLQSLLAANQPLPPLVKRPELYLGTYGIGGSTSPGAIATVTRAPNLPSLLVITIVGFSTLLVPQDAVDPRTNATMLQLSVPSQFQECQMQELLAFDGQYASFDLGPDPDTDARIASGFSVQGLGYGLVYSRIK